LALARRAKNMCVMWRKTAGRSSLAGFPFPPRLQFGYREFRYITLSSSSIKVDLKIVEF
jgi:hypothetical protein